MGPLLSTCQWAGEDELSRVGHIARGVSDRYLNLASMKSAISSLALILVGCVPAFAAEPPAFPTPKTLGPLESQCRTAGATTSNVFAENVIDPESAMLP